MILRIRILETIAVLLFCLPGHSFAEEIWTHYTTDNSGLISNHIEAIAFDDSGRAWFGYGKHGNGITCFDGKNWTTHTVENEDFPNLNVYSIACDDYGNVWVVTGEGPVNYGGSEYGVSQFDGIKWKKHYKRLPVKKVITDHKGMVWVMGRTSEGFVPGQIYGTVSFYNGSDWTTYFVGGYLNDMAVSTDNNLWFTASWGAWSFDSEHWKYHSLEDYIGFETVAVDSNNITWFTIGEGILSILAFDGSTWTFYDLYEIFDDIEFSEIRSTVVDCINIKWFATDNGLLSFNGESWKLYNTENSEIPASNITTIQVAPDNTLWIGTAESGVIKFKHDIIYKRDSNSIVSQNTVDETSASLTSYVKKILNEETMDYFPLEIGNTWKYRRIVEPSWIPFEDTVIITIIGTKEIEGKTYYQFLDGRKVRKDEQENIYGYRDGDHLYFDFTPIDDELYSFSSPYYLELEFERKAGVCDVPAGSFDGYGLYCSIVSGIAILDQFLAPSIGLISWRIVGDITEERLELTYAIVNGKEYGITSVKEHNNTPQQLLLHIPYPNPFNVYTTLTFSLPSQAFTNLIIYNITGQKIRNLISEIMWEGTHSLTWNGKDDSGSPVTSGIYLIMLQNGQFISTKKVVLIK